MNKLLFIFTVAAFLLAVSSCGDDNGPADMSCENSIIAASNALSAFAADDQSVSKCQAAIQAIDNAVRDCDQFVSDTDLQAWNDFINSNPCDSI
jgi:hypothetical protein